MRRTSWRRTGSSPTAASSTTRRCPDHFAIIPTLQVPRDLERKRKPSSTTLVLKRFLAVFFPAAEYRVTTRMTDVQGHRFRTDGKVLVAPGWLAVYGKEAAGRGRQPGAGRRRRKGPHRRRRGRWAWPPSRRPATTRPRCCPPWKARASWWKTRNCAKPCPNAGWARRPRGRPLSKAC